MASCSSCAALSLDRLTQEKLHSLQVDSGGKKKSSIKGILFLQSAQTLHESAKLCQICDLFQKALKEELEASHPGAVLDLSLDPLLLRAKFDPLAQGFPSLPLPGNHMTSIQVIARQNGSGRVLKGRVRIYADQSVGKLIRPCDIVGRPQLSGIACPKTIDLLSQWVSACKERHPQCSETLSGASTDEKTDPVLPTRILKMDNNSVRLVESKGLKGRYVTLSYCWGPPEKMPVVTTRANFSNHLQNVDVSKLPKTYQDAITICRRMSILYLWIDSLCIIQDDRDDWLKESVTMGSIYECADFTIAPSHAPDSWHGFLHLRERQGEPVELSNFLGPEDGPGVKVFARVREEAACDVFPEAGALNYRAWATQEWLLSRRVVFFAPASLMWSCKHITQRETGERCFTISRNTHWKSVVEGFSSRKLTYPMDKMVALEGLRTEWGKRTGYTYMSGVWKETLPDQLIWHVSTQFQGHIHDPLKLPSWSWMHVPSAVRFLPINGAKSICKSIEVSENGKHIIVMGRFKLISVVSEMPEVATGSQNLDGILKDIHGLHGLDFKKAHGMACAIVENGLVIGWVIYDQMESVTDDRKHFALAVMSTVRLKDDQREHLAGHTTDDKLRETWVLIVRKTGKDIYERIGAGKIYGRDPWNRIMMDEVMLC